eukprot:SAG31_NODE_1356_length_8657_cov_4.678546_5_plen_312_part_00
MEGGVSSDTAVQQMVFNGIGMARIEPVCFALRAACSLIGWRRIAVLSWVGTWICSEGHYSLSQVDPNMDKDGAAFKVDMAFMHGLEVRDGFEPYGAIAYFYRNSSLCKIYWCRHVEVRLDSFKHDGTVDSRGRPGLEENNWINVWWRVRKSGKSVICETNNIADRNLSKTFNTEAEASMYMKNQVECRKSQHKSNKEHLIKEMGQTEAENHLQVVQQRCVREHRVAEDLQAYQALPIWPRTCSSAAQDASSRNPRLDRHSETAGVLVRPGEPLWEHAKWWAVFATTAVCAAIKSSRITQNSCTHAFAGFSR